MLVEDEVKEMIAYILGMLLCCLWLIMLIGC